MTRKKKPVPHEEIVALARFAHKEAKRRGLKMVGEVLRSDREDAYEFRFEMRLFQLTSVPALTENKSAWKQDMRQIFREGLDQFAAARDRALEESRTVAPQDRNPAGGD